MRLALLPLLPTLAACPPDEPPEPGLIQRPCLQIDGEVEFVPIGDSDQGVLRLDLVNDCSRTAMLHRGDVELEGPAGQRTGARLDGAELRPRERTGLGVTVALPDVGRWTGELRLRTGQGSWTEPLAIVREGTHVRGSIDDLDDVTAGCPVTLPARLRVDGTAPVTVEGVWARPDAGRGQARVEGEPLPRTVQPGEAVDVQLDLVLDGGGRWVALDIEAPDATRITAGAWSLDLHEGEPFTAERTWRGIVPADLVVVADRTRPAVDHTLPEIVEASPALTRSLRRGAVDARIIPLILDDGCPVQPGRWLTPDLDEAPTRVAMGVGLDVDGVQDPATISREPALVTALEAFRAHQLDPDGCTRTWRRPTADLHLVLVTDRVPSQTRTVDEVVDRIAEALGPDRRVIVHALDVGRCDAAVPADLQMLVDATGGHLARLCEQPADNALRGVATAVWRDVDQTGRSIDLPVVAEPGRLRIAVDGDPLPNGAWSLADDGRRVDLDPSLPLVPEQRLTASGLAQLPCD